MNARNILIVIALLLAGLFGWTWMKNSNLKKDLSALELSKADLMKKNGDLTKVRDDLMAGNDELTAEVNRLTEEKASLEETIQQEKSRTARRNATIKKLKATNEVTINEKASLEQQISDLLAARKNLEAQVSSLNAENADLKQQLGIVQENLSAAQTKNADLQKLNNSMQSEIANLTLKNFKATAFQVDLERRRSKTTVKGRRAKKIKVAFDLADVPEKYHGVRPIYMVIQDANSKPIPMDNPIKASVNVNGQSTPIIAAEQTEQNIKDSQRVIFNHSFGKKLKKGFYRIIIYTDIGILGANTFQLR